ncbi:hypothetical protein EDD18DRAFT_1113397 [Armillaria luteobubalina]|uniref:Uncharacterized protein n=1 Tax=Armillaria luteobubalina TaxID=153913 RepID=A0AA39TD09_9AGAR|nr:hypothetical protein EDD18DRAFT_1113397 [Armillaria luteobubalina]
MAHSWIYEHGYPVDGKAVNDLLKSQSLTPNHNAFSEKLLPEGINIYELFVPDQMHEVEGGGWKSYFTHLICICHACGSDIVQELNKWNDTTSQKKFAACDYEDTIQCALPCFEGLLPKNENKIILNNLFDFATWHGFTKL